VDAAADPFNYISYPHKTIVTISRQAAGGLDERVRTEAEEDTLLADAADPYATLRSVYLQNREAMVRGEAAAPPLEPIDSGTPGPESAPSDPPASSAAPSASPTPDAGPSASAASVPAVTLADNPNAPIATARDYRPRLAAARSTAPEA
jgi:phospholipid-binding lipoprotein MlaA